MIAPARRGARPCSSALWRWDFALRSFLVYGVCNNFRVFSMRTGLRWHPRNLTAAWELHIPFVPGIIVAVHVDRRVLLFLRAVSLRDAMGTACPRSPGLLAITVLPASPSTPSPPSWAHRLRARLISGYCCVPALSALLIISSPVPPRASLHMISACAAHLLLSPSPPGVSAGCSMRSNVALADRRLNAADLCIT